VKDRWTPSLAFLVALAIHSLLLLVAGRQYMASASNPSQLNQAAQRLTAVNGRPVRFVYVKDMIPSKEPPLDPSRLSDVNRRGASPDPRKGDSPDPASMGSSAIRQSGGPGGALDTRPAMIPGGPSAPPRPPSAPRQPSPEVAQRQAAQRGRPQEPQERPATNEASKPPGPGEGRASSPPGKPVNGEAGLPVAGTNEEMAHASPGSPAVPPPQRQGLGAQIQNMMLGSLQGGFHNPNASRLATGALSFDTAAWDLGPYARQVQERVQSNWHVPEAQMVLRQKGWVAIRFNIQKNGQVTDLQVIRTSGIPSYDQSAVDALRSSSPLPPLPSQVTVPQLGGVFRFFYNMTDEND
jgi:protein TonB